MAYIDFHVHIDFYDNPWEIIDAYESRHIYALFVTNLPEIFEKHFHKYIGYKYVKLALGYHPELISEYPFNQDCFASNLKHTNYIGEIGLDFLGCNDIEIRKQVQTFKSICHAIKDYHKILSIHSRKAEDNVLEILLENKIKYAVFHWYTGSIKLISEIVKNGYYFSVNYGMLKSKTSRNILKSIPLNRILFETDGPFIRKEKRIITPIQINEIYAEFNEFYQIDNFEDIVYFNFKKLLKDRLNEENKSEYLLEN